MKITEDKFVSLSYDLNVGEGDERELMEKATKERPLNFVFGMGMMLEAFEKYLNGLEAGDKFSFSLTSDEAYGEYEEDRIVELPKNIFEVEGKFDDEKVVPGAMLPMMDMNGNRLDGAVVEVKDDQVVMDFNHPLAGETLHFDGEVLEVREPSAEEIAALSSPGGCNCGDCGDHDHEEGGCGGNCNH